MLEFRSSSPTDIPALRRLWTQAFGDSGEYLDIFFRTAYAPERSRVVCRDGKIVGGAYWLRCALGERKLAYVYAVAIEAGCQGQGLGSMLMEDIHRLLTAQGCWGVILVPGDEELRQYYQRFGYRTVSYRRKHAPKPGVPITPAQYARLRRAYLPDNGIVQEGENLALLGELADFYGGNDFICAVSRREGQCLELLSKEAPASGEKIPYTMAKALTDEPMPEEVYFGFGFD